MKRPILETDDISIIGAKFRRGTSNLYGHSTPLVGYFLTCSNCPWKQKVNGPLREARKTGRRHLFTEHGVKMGVSNA